MSIKTILLNMPQFILLLLLVLSVKSAELRRDDGEGDELSAGGSRTPKLFKIVTIQPTLCSGTSEVGVCKSKQGCTAVNGTELGGKCGTYEVGICCLPVITPSVNEVPVTVHERVSVIKGNTNFEDNYFNFPRLNGSCQIRLDFKSFSFKRPTPDGICAEDAFSVTGSVTVRLLSLCGPINRPLFLSYGNSEAIKLNFHSQGRSPFEIKVQHIDCNSMEKVDDHCLLNYNGNSGTVESFGYGAYQILGLEYNICVGGKSGTPPLTWEMCMDDDVTNPTTPGMIPKYSFYTSHVFGHYGGIHNSCSGKASYVGIPGVGTYCGGYFARVTGAPTNILLVKTVKDDYMLYLETENYPVILSSTLMLATPITCAAGPGAASIFELCGEVMSVPLKCACKGVELVTPPFMPSRPELLGFCLKYSPT